MFHTIVTNGVKLCGFQNNNLQMLFYLSERLCQIAPRVLELSDQVPLLFRRVLVYQNITEPRQNLCTTLYALQNIMVGLPL